MKKKKEIMEKKHLGKIETEKLELLDIEISLACEDREWEKLVNVLGSLETENGSKNEMEGATKLKKMKTWACQGRCDGGGGSSGPP